MSGGIDVLMRRLCEGRSVSTQITAHGAVVSVFGLSPDEFCLWRADDLFANTRIMDVPRSAGSVEPLERWLRVERDGADSVAALTRALAAADRIVTEGVGRRPELAVVHQL